MLLCCNTSLEPGSCSGFEKSKNRYKRKEPSVTAPKKWKAGLGLGGLSVPGCSGASQEPPIFGGNYWCATAAPPPSTRSFDSYLPGVITSSAVSLPGEGVSAWSRYVCSGIDARDGFANMARITYLVSSYFPFASIPSCEGCATTTTARTA